MDDLTRLLVTVVLNLNDKVEQNMAAIDDLRIAESELRSTVLETIGHINDLVAHLNAAPAVQDDAALLELVAKINELRSWLVGVLPAAPVSAPVAPSLPGVV